MSEEAQQTEQTAPVPEPQPERKGFWSKVDNWFGITSSGSNYRKEIIAGLTTFMAMVYILMVNAGLFENVIEGSSDPYGAAYIATAIGAIAGTMLMAFLAKMPLAQASGMGINAYIVYTLIGLGADATGLTYANCMVFTLIDGVIFLILTVTGLRKKIFAAIPKAVRHAIPVGIGLFIAFIGLQQAGVIVESSTLTGFVSFNVLSGGSFMTYADGTVGGMLPALIAILGVIAIAILSKKNVKGAILWGIIGSAVLFYILAGISVACGSEYAKTFFGDIKPSNPFNAFKAWGTDSVGAVFYEGFNFGNYLGIDGNTVGSLVLFFVTAALSMCIIDMFDTIGTLYGACAKGNLLDENGTPIRMEKMMLADAIATCTGAIAGTSTVTTFVESSSGVVAGGRTGFTALVTALCFIVAMFLSPIAQLVPRCATATALIWVGVLMMTSVTKVEWTDPAEAIVAFMTFMIMLLGYSISDGIGMGIITYIIVSVFTGKIKKISVPTWIIGAIFVVTFLLT